MKQLSITLSAAVAATCIAASQPAVVINEIPYAEGTVYISVSDGGTTITSKAIEIESDTASIDFDLSQYAGHRLLFQAFQDLNENRNLDFDTYGRPTEPCLREEIEITPSSQQIYLKLNKY